MLRRLERFHRQVLQLLDAFLLCAALMLAHGFRSWLAPHLLWFPIIPVGPLSNYVALALVIAILGPLFLHIQGFYRPGPPRHWWLPTFAASKAVLMLWLLLLAIIVLFRIPTQELSRAVLLVFVPLGILTVVARDLLYRGWISHSGQSAYSRHHVMVCGTRTCHERWRETLERSPRRDLSIKAMIDLRVDTINEFIRRIHRESIDIVIFEFDDTLVTEQNQAILACETEGVEAWVTADFVHTVLAKPRFDELLGRGLLVYRTTPEISWQLLAKAVLDFIGAAILLALCSPLVAFVAIAVRVTSGSPVIFSQQRSGRHGRPFTLYKFRTMVSNAEQRQEELRIYNQMQGPAFKMKNDPRLTPFGAFLRRSSLDELPQLWNVLRGEMSLVGPRPLPLHETDSFVDFSQRRRMSVKPGLTCLWQIAGRSEIDNFANWVRLDLDYIDHWSIWLDLLILLRTIPAVLSGRGAR